MMVEKDDEESLLRSVALQNAQSILQARRQIEQELAEERERLRITLASIGDGVISTDAAGRVTYLNGVAEALTGWPQAEAAGRPLADVFHIVNEHTRQAVENPALRALQEGRVVGLANHTVLVARDGAERLIDDSAAPMRDQSGATVGAVLVFRDVSERKQAQEAMARLAAIVESSDDAIVSKTLDGVIRSWNTGAERIFGHTAAEAEGKSITLIIPSDRLAEERDILARLCRGERIEHFETVRVAKDGRLIDVSITVSPIRDREGRIIGASKIGRDITDRKRAEQALRDSEAEFRTTFEGAGVGKAQADLDGRFIRVNPKLCNLLGYTAEELLRLRIPDVTHPEEREADFEHFRKLARGEASLYAIEKRYIRKTGEVIWARVTANLLRDANGRPMRAAAVIEDITSRKQAEAALAEASRRKDEFLATLAHELRNPLAPIRTGLQILCHAQDEATAARVREMMDRQLEHTVRLIDDLLDISRITTGKVTLRRERVPLQTMVEVALEACRPQIEAARHTIAVDLAPDPLWIDGDVTRIAQVVMNLLNNAAKYTPEGGHVRLWLGREGPHAVVRVTDTGLGIPAEMLSEVFEMFTQVNRTLDRSQGGLGIGLALVKRLVEMHGGAITVESPGANRGSTFTVRLPWVAADQVPLGEASAHAIELPPAGFRVLIVDDNVDAADSLAILLELSGHTTRTAYSSQAALKVPPDFVPEVAFLDLGLPVMDGLELARRLRQDPHCRGAVLVALTGWGSPEDRERTRQAGFDHHLTKPVSGPEVANLLRELAKKRP